jgi:hypothetical protein
MCHRLFRRTPKQNESLTALLVCFCENKKSRDRKNHDTVTSPTSYNKCCPFTASTTKPRHSIASAASRGQGPRLTGPVAAAGPGPVDRVLGRPMILEMEEFDRSDIHNSGNWVHDVQVARYSQKLPLKAMRVMGGY